MKQLIERSMQGYPLTYAESFQIIEEINAEKFNAESLTALLISIQLRGIQIDELNGFRDALLQYAVPVDIDGSNAIDLCGTGGDGKDTFNISTTASLVLAAMGTRVVKHGNYGVSSICGSSNVLHELGFNLNDDVRQLNRDLDTLNFCFLHAPLFHPALRTVAPIRKNLGIRTIFNSLGPLVNPVQPAFQLTGTFSLELARIYQHVLKGKRKEFKVIYSLDGYDEITLTDTARIYTGTKESNRSSRQLGLEKIAPYTLSGGATVKRSAQIVRDILNGKGSNEQNYVVACNAAEAIHCIDPGTPINDSFSAILQFIQGGFAGNHFKLN